MNDITPPEIGDLMESDGEVIERPRAWARLRIDLRLLNAEQIERLFHAEAVLREIGISWDSGIGGGRRDWELDWSLHGADIEVRPLFDQYCNKKIVGGTAYWKDVEYPNGRIVSAVFCSEACRAAWGQELPVLNQDSAPAGLEVEL